MSNNTQNIDQNTLQNYSDILYKFYYDSNIKSYNDSLDRFNKGIFNNSDYYMTSKIVDIDIDSNLMDDIMKQYADILTNKTSNQVDFRLTSYTSGDDGFMCSSDIVYVISYVQYDMVDISKVDSIARHMTKSAIFKIQHQPNSNDVVKYMDIINNSK